MKSTTFRRFGLSGMTVMLAFSLISLPLRLPRNSPLTRFVNHVVPTAEAAPFFNGKISFTSDRTGNKEVFVMNPDGTNPVNISNSSGTDENADWSPDGKKLAFSSNRDGDFEIFSMNEDGSNQVQLTNSPTTDGGGRWSPDGTKIAFQTFRTGNFEIFVMNADGSNPVNLSNNAATELQANWSPDGAKIVFTSNRDGNSEVYIMKANGSNQVRLTNDAGSDQSPSFSPNGAKILFSRVIAGLTQIMVMNPDGSNVVQLTNAANNLEPAFSPDGTKIAFVKHIGDFEIMVMDADGSDQVQLTDNTNLEGTPRWQPVLPFDTIGVYRPSTSQFLERNTNTPGPPNATIAFGQAGDLPIAGDWNGDGISDVGVFRNGQFLLRQPAVILILGRPVVVVLTLTVNFGTAGDLPVVGDWNGDGKDTPGVYRPSTNVFFLTNGNANNSTPPVDFSFGLGAPGDLPVAGDWNGNGVTTVGVYRPSSNTFFLTNSLATAVDISFALGAPGDVPLAGDWNGDGTDTVGVFRPANASFFLANSFATVVDVAFTFGLGGDQPVSGVWNKPPNSGVNDPSEGTSQAGQVQQFTTTCSDIDGWRNISTIDFKIAKSDGNGNGVPIAFWVVFDEANNLIYFYDPDSQFWSSGTPGTNVVLSSRFADLNLAQTTVQGSGPNGRSVKINWSVVFKGPAVMKTYKQFLQITDDSGFSAGFDRIGSWSVSK
jgi:hypothetical protein